MTTLTIRIDSKLKKMATRKAGKLDIPLTLVVKNALKNFVNNPQVIIGEPEDVFVTPKIQSKMENVGILLSRK